MNTAVTTTGGDAFVHVQVINSTTKGDSCPTKWYLKFQNSRSLAGYICYVMCESSAVPSFLLIEMVTEATQV